MLSLTIIAWNEAQTIETTINSVKDYVDEIIVGLDSTSDDGTEEIVQRLATKVIQTHLSEELEKKSSVDDDPDWGFSKARNLVFDACKKDNWRLVLDGHETILNPEKIVEAIKIAKDTSCDGIGITMHFEPRNNIPHTIFKTTRFMGPAVRYNNPQHNVPVVKKEHAALHIIVEHRKSNQATKARQARNVQRTGSNIDGFRNRLDNNPNDSRSWYYLATAYKENARYQEGIDAFKECLKYSRWNEERWHARTNMGLCYSYLNDKEHAREQFVLALEEFPPMAEAYYYLADLAYKQERFREAEVWLAKCIQLDIPVCRLFVNPKIYMVNRYDLFSMVYSHIGKYKEAVEQAEKAIEVAPSERINKNIRIWKDYITPTFISSKYWDARYRNGRTSGQGSYGKLAEFKARTINKFIEDNQIKSLIDFGCGDGNQLQFFKIPTYLGVDVSEIVIKKCSEIYKDDSTKTFEVIKHPEYLNGHSAELVLSLDVLFHLIEDDVYNAYMNSLFKSAQKFIVIYSSNFEKVTAIHERERKFTDYVQTQFPKWKLIEKINNPWPLSKHPEGSLSDFYIYKKND